MLKQYIWTLTPAVKSTIWGGRKLMDDFGFCNVLIIKDFYGKDRFVSCCKLQ